MSTCREIRNGFFAICCTCGALFRFSKLSCFLGSVTNREETTVAEDDDEMKCRRNAVPVLVFGFFFKSVLPSEVVYA